MATINGTNSADTLYGTSGADSIFGFNGNDTLKGGGGADRLDGGSGYDTIFYTNSNVGVSVNLATRRGFGGTAEGDTYVSIENVYASSFNEHGHRRQRQQPGSTGSTGADVLKGGGGYDYLEGGTGDDILKGGGEADWAQRRLGYRYGGLSPGRADRQRVRRLRRSDEQCRRFVARPTATCSPASRT